jgi:hypothetical protein
VEGMTGEGVEGESMGGAWKTEAGRAGKEIGGLGGMRVEGGEKVERVGRPAEGRPLEGMVGEVIDVGLVVDVRSHTSKLT